jgi:hypothetical protein
MADPKFSIGLIAGLTQAGTGDFPLVRAKDVDVNGETLLNYIPVILTQEEYDILVGGGTITLNGQEITYEENRIYMIKSYAATSADAQE